MCLNDWEKQDAVVNFREYLRIPTVHPDIDYNECVNFIKRQAESMSLPVEVYYYSPGKPVVIITWAGTEPNLQSVLLNSHMDVVPVFEESWTYPPFEAHVDTDGKIFARGAQDMKCVGIQYLEAIREFKKKNIRLKRSVHISFLPDEEIGGNLGMCLFLKSTEFTALNIGIAFDEGIASPTEDFSFFYAERTRYLVRIRCTGTSGHGSLLLSDTAGEKMRYVIDKMMDFRKEQELILKNNTSLTIGDVTTINLTMLEGGVQSNIVPQELSAVFDIRLAIDVDIDQFGKMMRRWCTEAGTGVFLEQNQETIAHAPSTKMDDSNKFWIAFKAATDELGITIKPLVFPGNTDGLYIRELGIPVFGFSPMNNTPVLLHDHDECIKVDVFLRGIQIYEKIIQHVCNI